MIDIFYAPVWWYSKGLWRAFIDFRRRVRYANEYSGFVLWLTNLFVPMFGQYDTAGRIISFFARLFQVIGRFIIFSFLFLVGLVFFAAYILLPVIAVWRLVFLQIGL